MDKKNASQFLFLMQLSLLRGLESMTLDIANKSKLFLLSH